NLPLDTGMSYVFVQHQDPNHPSSLTELLTRATQVPVQVVQDAERLAVNRVYVMPPNTNVTITDGTLHLNPRSTIRGLHMPIDHFFQSLAEHHKDRAIAVLLSGTASDGTIGMKAIKEMGGITFAQDEKSAKYHGMPRSAIEAGVVDFVLPPEKIA